MTKLDFKIGFIWFAFLGILLFMTSCKSQKPLISGQTTTIKDSTVTKVTYRKRDTTITIPGDTLKVKIPFYELTPEPQTFKSGTQKAKVSLSEDEQLNIECITEDVDRLFELIDTVKSTLHTIDTTKKETIIVPELYVPWFIKILAWAGGISLAFIASLFILKFINR